LAEQPEAGPKAGRAKRAWALFAAIAGAVVLIGNLTDALTKIQRFLGLKSDEPSKQVVVPPTATTPPRKATETATPAPTPVARGETKMVITDCYKLPLGPNDTSGRARWECALGIANHEPEAIAISTMVWVSCPNRAKPDEPDWSKRLKRRDDDTGVLKVDPRESELLYVRLPIYIEEHPRFRISGSVRPSPTLLRQEGCSIDIHASRIGGGEPVRMSSKF
jgi:hypothetical protein